MTIVVGYRRTPEGVAALRHAVEEAAARGDDLAVVHVYERGEDSGRPGPSLEQDLDSVRRLLDEAGVPGRVVEEPVGVSVVDRMLGLVEETSARMLVIGIRRRSPVGKLLLGSNAQQLILQARCPVLCVPPSA
jgi:nucleotide-binding universal stress UspA family protein